MSPLFIDHDSAYNHVGLPLLAIGTFILISWLFFVLFLQTLKPENELYLFLRSIERKFMVDSNHTEPYNISQSIDNYNRS